MAEQSPKYFNFYRRYRWTAQNFTDLQKALSDSFRGADEGAFKGAALDGLDVSINTGMQLSVSAGVAVGPTGQMLARSVSSSVTATAPSTNPVRSLVVVRPKLTSANFITRPTSPFESVPLNTLQESEVVIIQGSESATPTYPAKQANDVVLCGLFIRPGAVALAQEDLDFEARENPGFNSAISRNTGRYDRRLLPFRSTATLLGIKPSQTFSPRMFTYPGRGAPSIYPKTSGGLYNNADTFLNFSTGAITGGDQASSAFTPTVPTGNNSIVATVTLKGDDTISVAYGTQGTRAQCYAAIQNQVTSGAGAIFAAKGQYKIAYVLVSSLSGAVCDIQVFDARPLGGGGGGGGGTFLDLQPTDDGYGMSLETRFGQKVLGLSASGGQRSAGVISVPQGYSQGSPISVFLKGHQSATGSGNVKSVVAYARLIRQGVDAAGSTANQRTATGQWAGAVPANVVLLKQFQLTDAAGQINGIGVQPGDDIEVLFQEQGSIGAEGDLYIRQRSAEVTFS